jgi:hypothetical protein
MSTRNLPGRKGRPVRKTGNVNAICEPTVLKMWKPRRLTTLWASTACYRDSFTFFKKRFYNCTKLISRFLTFVQLYSNEFYYITYLEISSFRADNANSPPIRQSYGVTAFQISFVFLFVDKIAVSNSRRLRAEFLDPTKKLTLRTSKARIQFSFRTIFLGHV